MADRAELTRRFARAALDALLRVDDMRLFDSACNRVRRALARTERAALALLGIDLVLNELRALAGAALLFVDVLEVFVHEVLESGLHRVCSRLAEAAQRCLAHRVGDRLELLNVVFDTAAFGNLVEVVKKLPATDTARRALTAGLIDREVEVELGDVDDAVRFVHDDKTTRTHDRANLCERLEVDRGVEELRRNDAAGRTASLSCLELVTAADAAADIEDDFLEGCSHRNFDKAGVVDLAGESKDLRALGRLGTNLVEPIGTLVDDDRNVCERLNIVDDGRAIPKTLDGRERRTGLGHAAVAFDRLEKSSLFAADECAGAEAKLDVEVVIGTENLFAEETVLASLLNGELETVNGERIFRADVDVALVGSDGVTGDDHRFENGVGVAFESGAVHVRAGVALVCVTDHVLLALGLSCGKLPLHTGGEACAAAATETGLKNFLNNLLRRHLEENLLDSLVAVACNVVVDLLRVDDAAVSQNDTILLLIERNVRFRNEALGLFRIVAKALNDAALDEVLVDDVLNIVGLDLHIERALRKNLDDRALFAEAETASSNDLHLFSKASVSKLLLEFVDDLVASAGETCCSAADENI